MPQHDRGECGHGDGREEEARAEVADGAEPALGPADARGSEDAVLGQPVDAQAVGHGFLHVGEEEVVH